ncbi:MAG: ComF family protein [Betaproteobacteria bacterium]|nr:ComF family protein [Betaproteobacteria bacterium]
MPNPFLVARQWWNAGMAALLPQTCFVCGAGAGSRFVCLRCIDELPAAPFPACPVCGEASPRAEVCGRCLRRTPGYDATRAAFAYEFPLREIVHAFKFDARFAAGRFLAEALVAAGEGLSADCIVPVPLHPGRLRKRGFNQAVLLARPLAAVMKVPLYLNAVTKDYEAPPQAGLTLDERRRNLRGAFRAVRRFDGLRVVVVDDVMTSGTTLDELAKALKSAGAKTVENLVVARA